MAMNDIMVTMRDKKSIGVSLTVNNSKHIGDDKKTLTCIASQINLPSFQGCFKVVAQKIFQTFSKILKIAHQPQ